MSSILYASTGPYGLSGVEAATTECRPWGIEGHTEKKSSLLGHRIRKDLFCILSARYCKLSLLTAKEGPELWLGRSADHSTSYCMVVKKTALILIAIIR